MRLLVIFVSTLCATCLGATCAAAQTGQWAQAEDQIPPYVTHIDRRHGHDHVYPDRGAIVRDLPHGPITVNYGGISYRFAGGVWYEQRGPAYIVVAPPIGLVVPQLPAFATRFDNRGKAYFYANDVFYRAQPELGGYVVVNDPEDSVPEQSQAPTAAPPSDTDASSAVATPQPNEASQPNAASQPYAASQPSAASQAISASVPSSAVQTPTQASVEESTPTAGQVSDASVSGDAPPMANPTGVAIQRRNGQSAEQEARDRYECYQYAITQTGFDPLASNGAVPPADRARRSSDYSRAQAACLEGRGYTVAGSG